MLITFGQPLAVTRNCDLIRSERAYRYVNSLLLVNDEDDEPPQIAYDPVPLLPALGQGRGHYGHYLLLGDDTKAVKFLGLDDDDSGFAPGAQLSAVPHSMAGEDYSYETRVIALFENGVFPVSADGFSGGVPCDYENPLVCATNDCGGVEMGCTAPPTSSPTMVPTEAPSESEETSGADNHETIRLAIVASLSVLGYLFV